MKLMFDTFAVPLICFALLCGSAKLQADVVWNESVNGDLSSLPASPTVLNFANGANTVIGTLRVPNADTRDYMTFTIGPNQLLTGLTLDAFSPGLSFQALNLGATGFTPGSNPAGNFLGLDFVSDSLVGTDMLPLLATGANGSTGFSTPLGPGTYTYLIQEITPGQTRDYQISFNVVPEPSSAAGLFLIGLLMAARRGRRS